MRLVKRSGSFRLHAYRARDFTWCNMHISNPSTWSHIEGDEDEVTCVRCQQVLSGESTAKLIRNRYDAQCTGCRSRIFVGELAWYLPLAQHGNHMICTLCQMPTPEEVRVAREKAHRDAKR